MPLTATLRDVTHSAGHQIGGSRNAWGYVDFSDGKSYRFRFANFTQDKAFGPDTKAPDYGFTFWRPNPTSHLTTREIVVPASAERHALARAALDLILDSVIERDTKAEADVASEKERRSAIRQAWHKKREAGPALYDALMYLRQLVDRDVSPDAPQAIAEADAALALATADRKPFTCRLVAGGAFSTTVYALNAEAAREEYAFTRSNGDTLPEEVEVVEGGQ